MSDAIAELRPESRERLTNFVHNAAQVLGVTPAAISQIVQANPALVDHAIHYEGERLTPIDPPPAPPPVADAASVPEAATPSPAAEPEAIPLQ